MQNRLQARFKNQLREFVVNFECLLDARVVQVGERPMNDLDRGRLLDCRAFHFHRRRSAVELVPIVGEENLFRRVNIAQRFERIQ